MKPDALVGPIPAGMRVWTEGGKPVPGDPYRTSEPEPGRLIVVHQWRDTEGVAAEVVGCVFLWMLVAVFTGVAITDPLGLVLWLPMFAMAVAMSWIVVSSIWNTTRITVEPGRLVVRHGPIAIIPSRELTCRDIDELYCKQIELAGNEGPPQSFALVARLRNDAEVILMAHLREPEPCMYAAEQISAYLERHGRG